MKNPRRRFPHPAAHIGIVAGLCACLVAMTTPAAWPQAGRTIKIVVPFPPGGSADIIARLLGDQISKSQGPTMLVENRPGGGASLAYETVAHAAPDGNTVVISGNSLVINPHLRKVNYDPLTSFAPICHLVTSPQLIVVHSASPYRTLADLLAAARAKPGELTFAGVGPAATQHIGIEQFKHAAGINMTYVPYAGGAPAVNALLGEHVTAVFANYSEVVEHLKAGKFRPLATASRSRIEPLPEVPTIAESGYKDFDVEVWFAVLAPAKTPDEMVSQLARWFTAAMQAPDVKPKLLNLGLYPAAVCGADFAAHIHRQYDDYARIIREANIKAQ